MFSEMLAKQGQDLIAHAVTEAGIGQVHTVYDERNYEAMSPGLDGGFQRVFGLSTQWKPAEGIRPRLHARRRPSLRGGLQLASELTQVLIRALALAQGLNAHILEAL